MTIQEIQIGTRLELELLNKNDEKIGQIYVSQLLEIQEDGIIVISAPIYEARLIFIPLQSHLRLAFVHNKYGLLGFTSLVIGSDFKDNIAVLIVQSEDELFKMQRRTHYRLDYLKDILIRLVGNESNTGKKTDIKAFTKNISGSGLCVVTEANIQKNTEIEVELNLSEDINIIAKCIVIRNTWFEVMKTIRYELGLQFTDITKKDQDCLIKYIYEQQRVRLKKELH